MGVRTHFCFEQQCRLDVSAAGRVPGCKVRVLQRWPRGLPVHVPRARRAPAPPTENCGQEEAAGSAAAALTSPRARSQPVLQRTQQLTTLSLLGTCPSASKVLFGFPRGKQTGGTRLSDL